MSPAGGGLQRPDRMEPGFCLAVGGNATAGRCVDAAWPQLLEKTSGRMVANFALPHLGVDAMLRDADLLSAAAGADLRFIELPDAITLSNRFYAVHPRRNDRFVRAEPLLQRLYPEVDFTDFTFIRHLIGSLWQLDAVRFTAVREELARCWLERMELLIDRLEGPVVLIWWGNRPPPPPGAVQGLAPGAPQLVDREMLAKLRNCSRGVVEMVIPSALIPYLSGRGRKTEMLAARELPGAAAHVALARSLLPWMRRPGG